MIKLYVQKKRNGVILFMSLCREHRKMVLSHPGALFIQRVRGFTMSHVVKTWYTISRGLNEACYASVPFFQNISGFGLCPCLNYMISRGGYPLSSYVGCVDKCSDISNTPSTEYCMCYVLLMVTKTPCYDNWYILATVQQMPWRDYAKTPMQNTV